LTAASTEGEVVAADSQPQLPNGFAPMFLIHSHHQDSCYFRPVYSGVISSAAIDY
jgi:hypothetical protein